MRNRVQTRWSWITLPGPSVKSVSRGAPEINARTGNCATGASAWCASSSAAGPARVPVTVTLSGKTRSSAQIGGPPSTCGMDLQQVAEAGGARPANELVRGDGLGELPPLGRHCTQRVAISAAGQIQAFAVHEPVRAGRGGRAGERLREGVAPGVVDFHRCTGWVAAAGWSEVRSKTCTPVSRWLRPSQRGSCKVCAMSACPLRQCSCIDRRENS